MNDSFDIYEFCKKGQAKVGQFSGNTRDFEDEAKRDSEEMVDPLEIWQDEPDSEYRQPDFDEYIQTRLQAYRKRIGPDLLSKIEIRCAGQSHKDLGWRWRYQQTKRKTINTFRKAATHSVMFPFYVFVCSQPTLLEWTRDLEPQLFEQLQEASERGQFDLVGGCMNECDCRIPSGEAFVRQRLHGQLYYMDHFGGRLSDIEWMPDTFGFANTLPQLLAKSGTTCFFTTKMGNNDTAPFPFTNFWWQSPDGSRVLGLYQGGGFHIFEALGSRAHTLRLVKPGKKLIATCESEDPAHSPLFGDEIVRHYGLYEGAGDGRSGPMGQEVAEMRKLVELGIFAGWTTAHQHFTKLKSYGDTLPTWADEIYYEYHRGTLTTQHYVKRMNRKNENVLGALEILASILSISGNESYPHEQLLKAWHAQLLMQFHDVLPGSSIPEVYDDCYDYWLQIAGATDNLRDSMLKSLEKQVHPSLPPRTDLGGVLVFHPHAFEGVLNLVEVPWLRTGKQVIPKSVIDAYGNAGPVIYVEPDPAEVDPIERKPGRLLFVSPSPLHPLSAEVFGFSSVPPASAASPLRASQSGDAIALENRLIRVVIQRDSNDLKIYRYNSTSGSFNMLVASGNLHYFHERTPQEQCWNIQKDYRNHEVPIPAGTVTLSMSPDASVLGEITIDRAFQASHFKLVIRVLADAPVVFLELLADWHEHDATLRWEWTHETQAEYSVAESPYGFCRRKTHPMGMHDIGRWEMYGQSWADVSTIDGAWGFTMFNEGKYGFDAHDKRLGLTVLRGPQYPTPDSLWIHDERAHRKELDGSEPAAFADQGTSLIRFGVMVHTGQALTNPAINQLAHEYNRPPIVTCLPVDVEKKAPPVTSFLSVSPANVEFTAWKRAEKIPSHFVVRLVEMAGVPETKVQLEFAPSLGKYIRDIVECDLLEREGILDGAKPKWQLHSTGGVKCTLTVRKCEVVSLLVKT